MESKGLLGAMAEVYDVEIRQPGRVIEAVLVIALVMMAGGAGLARLIWTDELPPSLLAAVSADLSWQSRAQKAALAPPPKLKLPKEVARLPGGRDSLHMVRIGTLNPAPEADDPIDDKGDR